MRRSLIVLLAAFMLVALVPSAALAKAKLLPEINVSCTGVAQSSASSWAVSGTASWTGQPVGTTAVPYAQVSATRGTTTYYTGYHDSSFTVAPEKKPNSMVINAVWVRYDTWYAAPGDEVWLGVAFVDKKGNWKAANSVKCAWPLPDLSE
jgi:hypothetical protein